MRSLRLFRMIRIRFRRFWQKLADFISMNQSWSYFKTCAISLIYNIHVREDYIMDTLLEPFIWLVDHYVQVLGPVFVVMIVILMAVFVYIAYLIGLPFYWQHSIFITSVALIVGHYLLFNVIFHYFMAYKTSPGYPPQVSHFSSSLYWRHFSF